MLKSAGDGYPTAMAYMVENLGTRLPTRMHEIRFRLAVQSSERFTGEASKAPIIADAMLVVGNYFYQWKGVFGLAQTLYCYQRAAKNGQEEAAKQLKIWDQENFWQRDICHHCHKRNATGSHRRNYLMCSRCGTEYYCSKDCQVQRWKSVHKHCCLPKRLLRPSTDILNPGMQVDDRIEYFNEKFRDLPNDIIHNRKVPLLQGMSRQEHHVWFKENRDRHAQFLPRPLVTSVGSRKDGIDLPPMLRRNSLELNGLGEVALSFPTPLEDVTVRSSPATRPWEPSEEPPPSRRGSI